MITFCPTGWPDTTVSCDRLDRGPAPWDNTRSSWGPVWRPRRSGPQRGRGERRPHKPVDAQLLGLHQGLHRGAEYARHSKQGDGSGVLRVLGRFWPHAQHAMTPRTPGPPEPPETACQGGGVPGAYRVRTPGGPGGPLSTLGTPGTRAPPWRVGLPGPGAGAGARGCPGLASIGRVGAHQVRPPRYAVSPTKRAAPPGRWGWDARA